MANDDEQNEGDDVNLYDLPNADSEVLNLKRRNLAQTNRDEMISLKIWHSHPDSVHLQPTAAAQALKPEQPTPVTKPKPKPPAKSKPPKAKPSAKQAQRILPEELSKVKLNRAPGNGQPSTITQGSKIKRSPRGFNKCPKGSTLMSFILLLTIIGWIVYTEIKNNFRGDNQKILLHCLDPKLN